MGNSKRTHPNQSELTSTARPNRYGRKTMLCVWVGDQKDVIYYELLKPGETVNTEHYRQQMINLNQALCEKRPEYKKRQHKMILLHDNAPSHTAKLVKETIWLGNTFACSLLTRLGSVRLLFICIDGTRTCSAALHFLRRCTKMAR